MDADGTHSRQLTIIVGVTGGIAAYKSVSLVRLLAQAGHSVHVIATEAALQFVGKPSFEAMSRNVVETELFDGVAHVRHVTIGQSADLIIIAPATANTIAKLAQGLADDLLTNTVLASRAPVLVAPAMHSEMWQNEATVANVATVRSRGMTLVGPAVGPLAGHDEGVGRMEEPEVLVAAALALVADSEASVREGDLAGIRVLVTAGGTREPIDPVRFVGNRSSGRQGVALAVAARDRGAVVSLIAVHLEVDVPEDIAVYGVGTALELRDEVNKHVAEADLVIMAAAVADYRPESSRDSKIKKEREGDHMVLSLVKNPDIIASISATKRDDQTIVGFAAETEPNDVLRRQIGAEKVARKKTDYLVVNRVGHTEGFGTAHNQVTVLNGRGDIVMEASGSKRSVADRILDVVANESRGLSAR